MQRNEADRATERNGPWNETERFTPFLENAVAVQRKQNGPFLEHFLDAYRSMYVLHVTKKTEAKRTV